ncbi:hypothetical protein RB623_01720 [Mesorhizobium sp. LHD-90]|uniref:hypothetical protein n=1 Tax=Mesorhizobium sp. LHD-90 TaxID=3071414 RepID=UPI0027DFD095|nr:hypothetical protein [Mesorhizobium sp. LHD-90]MDQ6432768.1 hypothetical protein [Mesorhizobium sp. LHD-90]
MKSGLAIVVTAAIMAVAGFTVGRVSATAPVKIEELDNSLKGVCQYSASSLRSEVEAGWPINSFAVWETDHGLQFHVLTQLNNPKCSPDPELAIYYLENHGLVAIGDLKYFLDESKKRGDSQLRDYLAARLLTD